MAGSSYRPLHLLAFAVTAAVLVGCGRMAPTSPTGYVGRYGAVAGPTAVNLDVREVSFTAVTFTKPADAAADPGAAAASPALRPALAGGHPPAAWLVFTGDVTAAGAAVTLSVTGVERDRERLAGAELSRYTGCAITATAGEAFSADVIAAILACTGAVDTAAGSVTAARHDPQELLIGNWQVSDAPWITLDITRASLLMELTIAEGFCVTMRRADGSRSDCLASGTMRIDYTYEATPTGLAAMQVAAVSLYDRDGTSTAVGPGLTDDMNRQIAQILPIYYTVDRTSMTWRYSLDGQAIYNILDRVSS